MDYERAIAAVKQIQIDLDALADANGHDADAATRCVTLLRSLRQSVAMREAGTTAVAAAANDLEKALKSGR